MAQLLDSALHAALLSAGIVAGVLLERRVVPSLRLRLLPIRRR